MSEHLSPRAIAQSLVDGAAPAHVQACAPCAAELAAARADADRFRTSVLPRTLDAVLARAGRRTRQWWFAGIGGALACACAVVLFLHLRPAPAIDEPEFAVKGEAMQVVARRGEHVFPVRDGAHLQPGDQLRFTVTPGAARFVTIVSIDGRDAASVYYPSTAVSGATTEGGSIVLDDAMGPERLFAIFSDRPLETAGLERLLTAAGAGGEATVLALHRLPLDYPQATLVFIKVHPP